MLFVHFDSLVVIFFLFCFVQTDKWMALAYACIFPINHFNSSSVKWVSVARRQVVIFFTASSLVKVVALSQWKTATYKSVGGRSLSLQNALCIVCVVCLHLLAAKTTPCDVNKNYATPNVWFGFYGSDDRKVNCYFKVFLILLLPI